MQLQSQLVSPIMTRRNTSRKKKLPETPYIRAVVMDIETDVLRSSDILAAQLVVVGLRPQVVNVLCISIAAAVTSLLNSSSY